VIAWERQTGFGVRVMPGKHVFVAQKRVNGRMVRTKVPLPNDTYDVDKARREAAKLLVELSAGIDRRTTVQGITLRKALELYMAGAKPGPRTKAGAKRNVEKYLADWLDRPLAALGTDDGREEVRKRHRKIAADVAKRHAKAQKDGKYVERNGHTTANQVMLSFSSVWRRAERASSSIPRCPTINVDRYKLQPKRDPIPVAQLPAWAAAVRAYPNTEKRDLLMTALYTGLRRSDVETMRWENVDLERAVLRIENPSKRRHDDPDPSRELPLPRQMVELLRARKVAHADALEKKALPEQARPWVFGAWSEEGHVKDPRIPVAGVRYRVHSLRHTFRDAAEYEAKLDIRTVSALMDHKEGRNSITDRYGRGAVLEQLREPMQRIADVLDRLLAEPETA
jgi:integrase